MAKEAFCVSFAIFSKKPFLRASKGKINAKSPADAEDPPGTLPGKPPERIDLAGRCTNKKEGIPLHALLPNKVNE